MYEKLLKIWFDKNGMFVGQTTIANEHLLLLNKTLPKEFHRKLRSIHFFPRYKGTELRTFLLYVGPVILENILDSDTYNHFLLFHLAISILCQKETIEKYIDVAEKLLEQFVSDFSLHYDDYFISYNIHMLLHLCEDVRKFGPLDSFSAFKFESFLTPLKKYVRANHHPLEQVAKRISECFNKTSSAKTCSNNILFVNLKKQYLNFRNLRLDITEKNKFIMLKNKNIFCISSITEVNGTVYLHGNMFKDKTPFFLIPIKSDTFSIYKCKNSFYPESVTIRIEEFHSKLFSMKIPDNEFIVFYPIQSFE
jgi:hypothetical protein